MVTAEHRSGTMELGTTEDFPGKKPHAVPGPFPGTAVEVWGCLSHPVQQHLGQHHLQPHRSSAPRATARTIHPSSPSLFFLKPKLGGIQPCSIHWIDKDRSSLVFPHFAPPKKPSLPPALQLRVSHSLKSSTGNICRREQTQQKEKEGGEALSPPARNPTTGEQHGAADAAGSTIGPLLSRKSCS